MENMKNDMMNKGNDFASEFKNKIQASEQVLEKVSQQAGERAGVMASTIVGSTADYVETSKRYISENPVKGAAIAALAGLVAGGLVSMAFRRKH